MNEKELTGSVTTMVDSDDVDDDILQVLVIQLIPK